MRRCHHQECGGRELCANSLDNVYERQEQKELWTQCKLLAPLAIGLVGMCVFVGLRYGQHENQEERLLSLVRTWTLKEGVDPEDVARKIYQLAKEDSESLKWETCGNSAA